METAQQMSFCFVCDVHFSVVPSLKNNAQIFLEIFLIQYFTVLVANLVMSLRF